MRDSEFFLTEKEEKKRYETHNNDINDPGYRDFTAPVVNAITGSFGQDSKGLDFGSGTGPVISAALKEKGFDIDTYDIYFDNVPEKLKVKYDYIVCCETAEHFKNPAAEFPLFERLLKPMGAVFLMTEMFEEGMDFDSWYYKNDPTHVFSIQKKLLNLSGKSIVLTGCYLPAASFP